MAPTNGQGAERKKMLKAVSNQRRIAADMSTDDQLANLNSLINNPPQNSRTVEITPELAQYVLENLNINNRPKKVKKIKVYAEDMVKGKWSLTGDTIKFGTDGHLKDGQNRMAACVRSNTPFTTDVKFGIEPSSFVHMDIGATRTPADVFACIGVPYPKDTGLTVRMIKAYKSGRPTASHIFLTNDQLRHYYNNDIDEMVLEYGIKLARAATKNTGIPVAPMAALFYVAWERGHSEKVKSFLEDLKSGFGNGPRSAVRYLLETIVRVKMENRNKIATDHLSILLARAWNNYKNGKASVKSDMTVSNTDIMPII